ncbi:MULTISPECIES: hypothetical protein [Kordiimonas]|jgi:hypothetical protein|uniref:hypothetical protein n=1 Tax=Kordiimonas TaxID=288021 RepID=UPI00257B47BC|nr:hypothetical protein [Kordiimonas sp. UBA4487]
MIQNVAGANALQPRLAAANGLDPDRDALRFNGAQERGFAFGKRKPVVDQVQTSETQSQTQSQTVETYSVGTQPPATGVDGADTNAVAVTRDGSFNIDVTISGEDGAGGKGVVHFEEGGSYSFSLSDHPGAKYRLVGLEGGNGVTNPNNIKGTIFLNGAEIKLGDLTDKASEFLKKRDEIAAKAEEAPGQEKKRAGDITLDDLKAVGLLSTPDVGVLNIHDDRFDRSKFTDKQVLSLKVAAKLATQETLNPIREDEDERKGRGLKLGHAKEGIGSYGRGLKLGHEKAPGVLAFYA